MNAAVTLSPAQLSDFLYHSAVVRPVFIWGPPGIGKSSLVEQFASQQGLDCVSLLGSQVAPEDLIGVPQVSDGVTRFCPPAQIARSEPYCLFLDELNACSHEVMKAFYSLIHERRIGEYQLPEGSVVIGAGNRSQDKAITRQMPSALINRMVHVHMRADHRNWLEWAVGDAQIHPWVVEYIQMRPAHLWQAPPAHEEPFSTPRSWHMLSDLLHSHGLGSDSNDAEGLRALAFACVSPSHAGTFIAFCKRQGSRHLLSAILKGDENWPKRPEDRDLLVFLAEAMRDQLAKELPASNDDLSGEQKKFAHRARGLIADLAGINLELAQSMVAGGEDGEAELPAWFLADLVVVVPRLAQRESTP